MFGIEMGGIYVVILVLILGYGLEVEFGNFVGSFLILGYLEGSFGIL